MGTKVAVFEDKTGAITPTDGTFEVTDMSAPPTLKLQGFHSSDKLTLMQANFAGDGWEEVTDGQKVIHLTPHNRKTVTPLEIGVYGLQGDVLGSITAYTEVA